jgi:tetratricopeptide (TPR) repeat protein
LTYPESLPFHYVLQQMPGARVNKSGKDGVNTVLIEDGPYEALTERLEFVPYDAVTRPQMEFATGISWQQVVQEYLRLSNDKLRSADVQPLLAKLNVKAGSRSDVVRRLVIALHKGVRYTGVEFGESSLIPQFPSETLKRKYGDCKDKAALLVTMLRAAGIPAHLALLDSGPGPDINPELPGLGMFDHAIVYLPASGGEPEMWIDATAQYSAVGLLPLMDYGRWALVVDEQTSALKKIPEFTAEQNLHRETRQFALAEYGPARIVEINEQIGPTEADYREYYTGEPKELREHGEKYVKDAYLADSLTSVEKTDPADLEKPFTVTYTAKGRRGYTDQENAVVYIYQSSLFSSLPDYFTTPEEKKKPDAEEKESAPPKKPRKLDWQFYPFVNEWHYKVTAPPGYKLRALPANKQESLGSARFIQKYSSNPEGTVAEAVLRFESGKSRLTVTEAAAMRDAVVKARDADAIVITFDHTGYSLLTAGKVREALAVYKQLAELHPKEALHKVQLANAYLTAGLGDKARATAKEAVALEPGSANAYATLGWVLQHDLIGRRFATGFDLEGALAAYRKALQLDPKGSDPQNKGVRADYAILLEHDAEGVRYSDKAHLDQAVAEFTEIKKQDEDRGKRYDDFVLYDLWYARKFKELEEKIAGLPKNETRRSLLIAAVAAQQGAEAAIKKSLEITSEDQDRGKALVSAGFMLILIRRYPEAADLYSEGSHLQSEGGRLQAFAESLRKTKPFEQVKLPATDPRSVVQRGLEVALSGNSSPEDTLRVVSAKVLELHEKKDLVDEARKSANQARSIIEANQLRPVVTLDIALSNAKYSVEGDDQLGYRITQQTPNAQAHTTFVVREGSEYKVVSISGPNDLGREALDRVERNDLAGARKWLDWARDNIRAGGGDDPISGPLFPRFWSKGQEADAAAMRLAALSLLTDSKFIAARTPELVRARDAAADSAARNRLNLALAVAYATQKHWAELLTTAQELIKAYPDSDRALELAALACRNSGKLDEWEKLLQARLQKQPDEPELVRSQARLALYRGDVVKSRSILKSLIDSGKASNSDLNQFGWFALMPPAKVDQEAVEAVERANTLTQNSSFNIMHTLVCLYAVQGKTKQARELLLKTMTAGHLSEPDSAIWLALATIAEQYGETDAARTMYARVEKDEIESPGSNYSIAQQRIAELKKAPATTARNAAQ